MSNKDNLPEGWEWVRLENICTVKGGKRLPTGADFSEVKTAHPYIRVTDFNNRTVCPNGLKYITDTVHEQIKNYIIKKDDVFLSIAGTIGVSGIIHPSLDGANLTENAVRLITDNKVVSNRYIVLFLNSTEGQEQIKSRTNIVGQPKLAIERLKTITIPLPPLDEQRRIAAIIEKKLASVEKLKTHLAEQAEAIKALPAAILRKAFAGEI
jgi:type I restriction enzyme S subunit